MPMGMEENQEVRDMKTHEVAASLRKLIAKKKEEGDEENANRLQKAHDHIDAVAKNEASSDNTNEVEDQNEIGRVIAKAPKPKKGPKTNAANMPLEELKSTLPGYKD